MKYKYNGEWVDVNIKALDSMVIGSIIQFVGTTIPTGWLECDGSTITQSAYPELYDLIGGTLPDFRGRVLVGQDTNDTDFNTVGKTGGSKELQAHSHEIKRDYNQNGFATPYGEPFSGWGIRQDSIGSATLTRTQEAGTGNSGNLQPYAVVKHIIKATNTTPTMASVVNATNSSTTDAYSCDYENKHYGGVELFTGYTSGNVTLSDSASNYSYIEVYGQKSGCYGYVKIYSPNGKQFGLAIHNAYESNNIQQIFGRYTISGTTITKDFEVYMNNNGTPSNSNDIKIEKVIGYK